MTIAVLDARPERIAAGNSPTLRRIVLARLASEDGATRGELVRELAAILPPGSNRLSIEVELAALVRAGQVAENRARFRASQAGIDKLLPDLCLKSLPKTWPELRDVRLVAKALGVENEAPARTKALGKPEHLRAQILATAFGLKLRGAVTCAKLRAALALVALERAFGGKIKSEMGGASAFNAKASRLLAGQLLKSPRDVGTDKRLVSVLAAEVAGASKIDLESLQLALLRRYVAHGPLTAFVGAARVAAPVAAEGGARSQAVVPRVEAPSGRPGRPPAASRPGLEGFVVAVQKAAQAHAEGWPGNRKTLIARVWTAIAAQYPGWGLSVVEFKAMLAEAHRTGHLVLATADLKDKRQLKELQDSAVTYKNTVWHLVRIEN